jgi:Tol biopolymer transport system component/DNA-binding winged helix-turn-helix (wHTH) protein
MGVPIHMTRKTVETLLVLAEHPGQVLTKQEIMNAVWPDRIVVEANLAQNIAVVRRTLAAEKGSPAFIETFPGRGYRLEGPVTSDPEGRTADAPAPRPSRRMSFLPTAAWGLAAVSGIAALTFIVFRREPAREGDASFRVVPVTRMAGKEYQPSLSPDGRSVVFLAAEDTGNPPAVWLSTTSDPDPRVLSRVPAHHSSPAWSPDGRRIAYLRLRNTGTDIVLVNPEDGAERTAVTLSPPDYGFEARLLTWSPDGEHVAVSHASLRGGPPGIWVVSLRTGQARALTHPGVRATGDLDPRFSPDGSRVTFIRMINRSNQEIFSIATTGGEPTQLTRQGKRISSHDWAPDGRSLLIASDHGGDFRIWRLNLHSAEPLKPMGIYSEFPIQISLARTAPALAYATLHQDRDIWRVDLKQLAWTRLIATTAQDASPVYSPSGDRIVFRSDRSGEEQLWISDAGGSNAVQVTRGDHKPSVGRWAPDGHALVFNNSQTSEIFLAGETGSTWNVRPLGARGVHPVFSAAGESIFAGGDAIVRIPAAGGSPKIVAPHRAEALQTSRDGKYVYFVREPGSTELWRVPADAAGPAERVLDGLVPGCTSCWSLAPDGVYYLGSDEQSFDRQALFFHGFGGKTAGRKITPYPEPLWPHGSGPFSLAPDRSALLCVRVRPSTSDIMLVSPFHVGQTSSGVRESSSR